MCLYSNRTVTDSCNGGTCSMSCSNCNKSECESSGICSDSHYFPTGISSVCVFPLEYYKVVNGYTLRQCPYYSQILSNIGCVDYYYNETECGGLGGKWITQATTKGECDAHGKYFSSWILLYFSTWEKISKVVFWNSQVKKKIKKK